MENSHWEGSTLVVKVREGVRFQDGEPLTAHSVKRAFEEVQKWKAPHPPGTYLNFHPDTRVVCPDDYTVRFEFPEPDGLMNFTGHAATLELAETEVGEEHWSRSNGG